MLVWLAHPRPRPRFPTRRYSDLFGRSGLQRHVRQGVELARMFEQWVAGEPGWELCAPRRFSVVCFRFQADDERNRLLLERVSATGVMFILHSLHADRCVRGLAVGPRWPTP